MDTAPAPTDRASAENWTRAALAPSVAETGLSLYWDDLIADLYRAAGKSWRFDDIDQDVFWATVWADRHGADNADRAEMVTCLVLKHAESTFGFDAQLGREAHRAAWERRRREDRTPPMTFAVPFDADHMAVPMAPDEHAATVALACDADAHRDVRFNGRTARDLFDVLVLA